jgi:hypothetical protein
VYFCCGRRLCGVSGLSLQQGLTRVGAMRLNCSSTTDDISRDTAIAMHAQSRHWQQCCQVNSILLQCLCCQYCTVGHWWERISAVAAAAAAAAAAGPTWTLRRAWAPGTGSSTRSPASHRWERRTVKCA